MLIAHAVIEILLLVEGRPHQSAIHAMNFIMRHFCLQKAEKLNMYLSRKLKRQVLTLILSFFLKMRDRVNGSFDKMISLSNKYIYVWS